MLGIQRLHFTFGPVQGFVAQSRRTRDLWAGSFILSHLAEAAIAAVEASGAELVLPHRAADMQRPEEQTQHGSVPNRLVAEAADAASVAIIACRAFDAAWQRIVDEVWDAFVAKIEHLGDRTSGIWHRQVGSFWERNWVVVEASPAQGPDPLTSRKNWRTTPATREPGDHCTMMGQLQELSGHVHSQNCAKQVAFWQALRDLPNVGRLNLAPDERLSAMALIKRLFPTVSKRAIGRELQAVHWPSTLYVAAVPWLGYVAREHPGKAAEYASGVKRTDPEVLGERQTYIKCLRQLPSTSGDFVKLDGNFFHEQALANPNATSLSERDTHTRHKLLEDLRCLYKTVGGRPTPFYGMLLMDGDSMGELLAAARRQSGEHERDVARAIGEFSQTVPGVVRDCNGVTIYAGGDDALAMLPLPDALGCAIALRDQYEWSFRRCCLPELAAAATISAALIYAHYHVPFRTVLANAHQLLDDVAKDATGRDSVAVAVFKPGGITCQWAAPWGHIRAATPNLLTALQEKVRRSDRPSGEAVGEFSSGFFYHIRDRFAQLTDDPLNTPGSYGRMAPGVTIEPLLLAEYLRGVAHRSDAQETERLRGEAKANIALLLQACRRVRRTRGQQRFEVVPDPNRLGIDGPLLARFLAREGKDVLP